MVELDAQLGSAPTIASATTPSAAAVQALEQYKKKDSSKGVYPQHLFHAASARTQPLTLSLTIMLRFHLSRHARPSRRSLQGNWKCSDHEGSYQPHSLAYSTRTQSPLKSWLTCRLTWWLTTDHYLLLIHFQHTRTTTFASQPSTDSRQSFSSSAKNSISSHPIRS